MISGLNMAQEEAVNYLQGPSLVLAGAGSGKTRVITHKIARLIQVGVAAENITAITFTNKAAAEMRERTKQLIGARASAKVVVCTFHALGMKLLKKDGELLGLKPQFSILDTDDVTSILKDAAGGSTDVGTARRWQWQISHWKNAGLNADQALQAAQNEEERSTAIVMRRYEERLSAYQAVDFDDLMRLPLKLLREHELARSYWQQQMRHILIDEYQDTNAVQYEFLKLLAGQRASFTAVGDDDQSIYGWRGATLDNLKRLPQEFPSLKIIKLEQNYRSTSAILRAANHVIGANPKLYPKNLWSDLGEGENVRVLGADNEEHEAERVVARIQSIRAGANIDMGKSNQAIMREFRDFAVLYRANHQSKALEKAFRKAQIPYKVSGGQSFFDKAEIKDLCAWFRLWFNNDDDPAFLRAITTPKRGIGHQSLTQLGEFAARYKVSLFEALFSPVLSCSVNRRAVEGLHEFGRYINDLSLRAAQTMGQEAAMAFLLDWLKEINYEAHLYDGEDNKAIAQARWSNVLDFCEWMSRRCGGVIDDTAGMVTQSETKSVMQAAQTIALLSTISEREQDQNVVTLSTLHAAKGLEWPHVMLCGVNEDILPFKIEGEGDAVNENLALKLQEERRLMYVGITRAQYSLWVSWTKARKKGREFVKAAPSRFIAEMALDSKTVKENPLDKIRALREEFAQRAANSKAI